MDKLITILGPTATGKTTVAAVLAHRTGGEVIGADSRQVYRGMDLGTGKDLDDYIVDGINIPYHLIDIADPGEEYNVFRFQQDFMRVYNNIIARGKKAIMCGGTGMYLESIILAYEMKEAPIDRDLRTELEKLSDEELSERLHSSRAVHNITDTTDRNRMIRAIEIEETSNQYPVSSIQHPASSNQPPATSNSLSEIKHYIFGIDLPRAEIRTRITSRLKQRLEGGMIEEVQRLLAGGLKSEQLEFYGLEYKYLTQYVTGKISFDNMFQQLNTAIHQFAKRQMTWFRRMEKKGVNIIWIDGTLTAQGRVEMLLKELKDENY